MPSSAYVDRGIMKWNPFDALAGHGTLISAIKYNLGKKDKPTLSDDQYEDMNRTITEAINENKEVVVTFFSDGYFHEMSGYIKKVDFINCCIIFTDRQSLLIEKIMNIIKKY